MSKFMLSFSGKIIVDLGVEGSVAGSLRLRVSAGF